MIPIHTHTTTEYDQLRGDIYALLASLLRSAPTQDALAWLQALQPDGDDNPDMLKAWSALALTAQHSKTEAVAQEYQDLFIGVGRGELMPFGCWYLTGSLMERPLVTLREDLKHLGYERQKEVYEPEDHIAALCEVLSLMVSQDHNYSHQYSFLQRHLFPWAFAFFTDLQTANNAYFYAPVGLLAHTFFQQEKTYFQQLSPAQLNTDNKNDRRELA
jgi:TorA maturation chaperone TorD